MSVSVSVSVSVCKVKLDSFCQKVFKEYNTNPKHNCALDVVVIVVQSLSHV